MLRRKKRKLTDPWKKLISETLTLLQPPPKLSISEWADKYAFLSPETSSSPGKFKAFKYQEGILDAVVDPGVKQVTILKAARTGFTKCLDLIIGYFISQDPSPILVVQPRVEDAEDYSRTEIAPMLRDTPILTAILGETSERDSQQRILKRVFKNGSSVSFVGSNSPGGFRRVTARIVMFDEIDGYPIMGAGNEGDQITLGTKRSDTFWNRKIILGSTPTVKGLSRIEKAFLESDQRYYEVPCPHCNEYQTLKFANLHWDKNEDGEHLPETAYFVCEKNGCLIEEKHKKSMIDQGKWVATQPFKGHAGFHIWAGYSLFPNACWANLAAEFLRVHKDPMLLRTFVNTTLGQTWEDVVESLHFDRLTTRKENYNTQTIPSEVRRLTCGIDTQGDRLEALVLGWGKNEECWVIHQEILYGDPAQQQIWVDLDKFLLSSFHTNTGQEIRISAACIDTGGHHANAVINFCRPRFNRRIFPIKGGAGTRPIWPVRASKTKQHERLFFLGVDAAKDAIYGRLRIDQPGPGYVHFPASDWCNDTFFEQLTAEVVTTRYSDGIPYRVWVLPTGKRNEVLDAFVYGLAAKLSFTHETILSPPKYHPPGVHVASAFNTQPEKPESEAPSSPFPLYQRERKKSGLAKLIAH